MLTELSAVQLAKQIATRDISCVEVVQSFLDRIDEVDPKLGCFLAVDKEGALNVARQAQQRVDKGEGREGGCVRVEVTVG